MRLILPQAEPAEACSRKITGSVTATAGAKGRLDGEKPDMAPPHDPC